MIRIMNIRLLTTVLLLVMTISVSAKDKQQNSNITSKEYSSLYSLPKFERAVLLIKHCEGMHSPKDYPYVGYGHRLQPGEKLTSKITKRQADSLLRSDLKKLCYLFRDYGSNTILLATLAYNCGHVSILDRKSTRLNSSHQIISYAVFCLKKKKNIRFRPNHRAQIFERAIRHQKPKL